MSSPAVGEVELHSSIAGGFFYCLGSLELGEARLLSILLGAASTFSYTVLYRSLPHCSLHWDGSEVWREGQRLPRDQ